MKKNYSGFTLIEVIATIVILGFISYGLVAAIQYVSEGYILARESSQSAEKIQAAVARIFHEISHHNPKKSLSIGTDSNSVTYYYELDSNPTIISFSNNKILLNSDVLIDDIKSLTVVDNTDGTINFSLDYNLNIGDKVVEKQFSTDIAINTIPFD